MHRQDAELAIAIKKHHVAEIVTGYLKAMLLINPNLFAQIRDDRDLGGRLFYKISIGDESFDLGDEVFLKEEFRTAMDRLLKPYFNCRMDQVKLENENPGQMTQDILDIVGKYLFSIESHADWRYFWDNKVNLADADKDAVYNKVARAIAYKAFVTCINASDQIKDPRTKLAICQLVNNGIKRYESPFLHSDLNFIVKYGIGYSLTASERSAREELSVFKRAKTVPVNKVKKQRPKNEDFSPQVKMK